MNRSLSQSNRRSRALEASARLLLFALLALLAASCGREAQPRAAQSAVPANATRPTTSPPAAAANQPPPGAAEDDRAGGDPRAQGDPSAPITVIEYGDYQ